MNIKTVNNVFNSKIIPDYVEIQDTFSYSYNLARLGEGVHSAIENFFLDGLVGDKRDEVESKLNYYCVFVKRKNKKYVFCAMLDSNEEANGKNREGFFIFSFRYNASRKKYLLTKAIKRKNKKDIYNLFYKNICDQIYFFEHRDRDYGSSSKEVYEFDPPYKKRKISDEKMAKLKDAGKELAKRYGKRSTLEIICPRCEEDIKIKVKDTVIECPSCENSISV